jgi:catechol 2,3-dioxygenase-like lactoylglutathione lyase family enzyme
VTATQQSTGIVTGFWHAGVTVSDLDASLAFYRDALGLTVLRRAESSAVAEVVWNLPGARGEVVLLGVPGSDAVVELYAISGVDRHSAASRPCDPAHGHFCLYVDDLEAMHERLVALGYRTRSNKVVCLVGGPAAGGKAVYVVDPDGYDVELFERPAASAG